MSHQQVIFENMLRDSRDIDHLHQVSQFVLTLVQSFFPNPNLPIHAAIAEVIGDTQTFVKCKDQVDVAERIIVTNDSEKVLGLIKIGVGKCGKECQNGRIVAELTALLVAVCSVSADSLYRGSRPIKSDAFEEALFGTTTKDGLVRTPGQAIKLLKHIKQEGVLQRVVDATQTFYQADMHRVEHAMPSVSQAIGDLREVPAGVLLGQLLALISSVCYTVEKHNLDTSKSRVAQHSDAQSKRGLFRLPWGPSATVPQARKASQYPDPDIDNLSDRGLELQ